VSRTTLDRAAPESAAGRPAAPETAGFDREFRKPAPLPPSVEIRSPRPEEWEHAWRLQREEFGLDGSEPPPHPGSRDECRILTDAGNLVSCLTVIHADLHLGGARTPMRGIRHVATRPDDRNQGYAGLLMRHTLQDLRRQGAATSVLFPFSFRYYRKFGYELGGNHCHVWSRPNCLPAYRERAQRRTADASLCGELARFYSRRAEQGVCSLAREEARWRALCADRGIRTLTCGDGALEGYALTTEAPDAYGGRVLRVLEMSASTPRAWRALLGSLSQYGGESVEWHASSVDLAASGILHSPAPLREGFKPRAIVNVRPMFQFRVVDLGAALASRLPAAPEGRYRLALRLRDDLLPENTEPLAVENLGGGARVRPARPDDPSLEADIRVFSQIFCGYLSPSQALSLGLCQCSSTEAAETADALFPAGDPFISELDRF